MQLHTDTLQELGLAKNEARIYEILLREGESPVGKIAEKSGVHRRNVYDTLNRLLEKGLAFEIVGSGENRYQAVHPNKLLEIVREKEELLSSALPDFIKSYEAKPHENEVFIYRGIEGVKNYMRDILRVGQDVYTIGGKGAWLDERVRPFALQFLKQAEKKGIAFHALFDHLVKETRHEIVRLLGKNHRFLPKKYSSPAAAEVFGDHVVIVSSVREKFEEDISIVVIINKQIAQAFRTWFYALWDNTAK